MLVAHLLALLPLFWTASGLAHGRGRTHKRSCEVYDYIVVGSGPGGATVARYLSENRKHSVLLLEAGPDYDADPRIVNPSSWLSNYFTQVPQFFYDEPMLPNFVTSGDSSYLGGRLLGGGSSLNFMQYVRPTLLWLETLYSYVQDPDWTPGKLLQTLEEIETYFGPHGPTTESRGTKGPLHLRPAPGSLSGAAVKMVKAFQDGLNVSLIDDYNDPQTPVGAFYDWQLTQFDDGTRASASATMISPKYRKEHKNLVVKTGSSVNYLTFKGKKATGVYYTCDGTARTAKAKKQIILSAGIHTSRILELSGIGNYDILEPLFEKAKCKRPLIANNTGVGEGLANDAVYFVQFVRNTSDPMSPNLSDLFVGGAWLPDPDGGTEQGSLRFSQWSFFDPTPNINQLAGPWFQAAPALMTVFSEGSVHIQSMDPLAYSLCTTNALNDPRDMQNWVKLFQVQLKAVADALLSIDPSMVLHSPDYSLLLPENQPALEQYITKAYIAQAHQWGSVQIGKALDSDGNVKGVEGLKVADVSMLPLKPDGNTQAFAYLFGATIAKKILAGK